MLIIKLNLHRKHLTDLHPLHFTTFVYNLLAIFI